MAEDGPHNESKTSERRQKPGNVRNQKRYIRMYLSLFFLMIINYYRTKPINI